MDKKELARLERLNQIKLDDGQKDDVLAFFEKREADIVFLNEIDTAWVEPVVQVMPTQIVLREDTVEQSFERKDLMAQAPQTDAGYFCVPRVIEG